jgi:hypothetical protein
MAYRRIYGMGAAGLPIGYSVTGACSMSNPPAGDSSTQVNVAGPNGFSQCMTDNQLGAMFGISAAEAVNSANVALVAVGAAMTGSPVPCTTPACLALTAGGSSSPVASSDTMLGPFDWTQIQAGNFASVTTAESLMIGALIALAVYLVAK